ncbi:hypothetical protein TWF706_010908 [Orbilia oligospora]|nr:hypothetical protein TWF103_003362 [Orbilia oligospora]KAF3112321.1 hypothetical protein TWF706_010908 [Orbilia oligospora]
MLLDNGAQPDLSDEYGNTPLSRAVEEDSAVVVQLLLAKNVKTDYIYKPTPLSRASEKGNAEIVKMLLDNGAQPDLSDEYGNTPLSRAVEEDSAAVVQLLLANHICIKLKVDFVAFYFYSFL